MKQCLLVALCLGCCYVTTGRAGAPSLLLHHQTRAEFTCPEEDGFFPVPGECTGLYYACIGGVALEQHCAGDYVFDPELGRCVPYETSSCKDDVSTTQTTTETTTTTTEATTTTTTASGFVCPEANGVFPSVPGVCGQTYYVCIAGDAFPQTCPGDQVFDPDLGSCADECTPEFQCPQENGFFPIVPGECNQLFYSCTSGQPYLQSCPGSSVFDPNLLICVSQCSVAYRHSGN